jgi:hypothetical protein
MRHWAATWAFFCLKPTDVSVAELTTSLEMGKDLELRVDKDLRHSVGIGRKQRRES